MNILKGFISIPTLSNNQKDVVSQFGEFSTYSQTFTKDLREYAVTAQPDVELKSLYCVDSDLNRVEPSASFIGNILAFSQWIYQQYVAKTIPADRNASTFISAITTQFTNMTSVTLGSILVDQNLSTRNMPEYVTYNLSDGSVPYQITLWFSDQSFRAQYDINIVTIIPPVLDISVFTHGKLAVANAVSAQGVSAVISTLNTVIGVNPPTTVTPITLIYQDPSDATATLNVSWTAVINGASGLDNQVTYDAIRQYLTNNSTYTGWKTIFPALYSESEFTILPLWGDLAIQPNAVNVGLYRSMVNHASILTYANTFVPQEYILNDKGVYMGNNLSVGSASYRSMTLAMIGNPNNLNAVTDLKTVYPDYTDLPSTDKDFARMATDTQNFALALNAALDVARTFNPSDILDAKYTKVVKRGLYYVAFVQKGYTFLVLTKYTHDKTN